MSKPDEWGDIARALARDAWWYATGRQDAGGIHIDAWNFYMVYGNIVHAFKQGVTTYRPSIQEVYRQMEQEVA